MQVVTTTGYLARGKRVLPTMLAVLGLVLAAANADAGLKHRYSFTTDTAAGGTFPDLAPGGNATGVLGGFATISGGSLILPGGQSGTTVGATNGSYASLLASGGNGINANTYHDMTLELWATTTQATPSSWERYFDIGGHNIIDTDPPNMIPGDGGNAGNSIFVTPNAGGAPNFRIAI